MGKGYRFGLAVLLAASLSLGPWLALAEAGAVQPDGPEQTPRVISSLEGLMDYFAQCEKELNISLR